MRKTLIKDIGDLILSEFKSDLSKLQRRLGEKSAQNIIDAINNQKIQLYQIYKWS